MKDLPCRAVDRAIAWYQRRLSPRKGWNCAHLVANGGQSCSAAVRTIIAERGLVRGSLPVMRRFAACALASMLLPSHVQGVCCCGPIPIHFRF
ncbi:membrane protein insertion efficiency factor YidD [Raineyella antarctica]|nr:membrane protein insertion efficiency factor YidD [Raineyella antarctica]